MNYDLFVVLSWAIIVVAVTTITLASGRFLKGQLKVFLKWLIVGMWLMCLGYSLIILGTLAGGPLPWEAHLSMYVVMSLAALYIFKAAVFLLRFSEDYGFARLESVGDKKGKKK
jgi:hypothetical protein